MWLVLLFDTSYLVPARYTIDVILYDWNKSGNVMFYDCCTALRFELEHGPASVHLKHRFNDWGNAVLQCVTRERETL